MFACHVDVVEAFGDTAVVAVAGAVGGKGKGKRIFTRDERSSLSDRSLVVSCLLLCILFLHSRFLSLAP